jgi:hypothetical protein
LTQVDIGIDGLAGRRRFGEWADRIANRGLTRLTVHSCFLCDVLPEERDRRLEGSSDGGAALRTIAPGDRFGDALGADRL